MIASEIEKGIATVDGLRIAYESAGAGTPAVVFVHGIFGDRGYFAAQRDHLAPRHRVITMDLRGHGESDVPRRVSVGAFERDVIGVLEAVQAGPVVLCGHSIPGAIALGIAAKRPELVRAVVMLDGVVFFPDEVRQVAVQRLLPELEGEHWQEALRGYLGRLIEPALPQVAARVMADVARARQEIASSFFDCVFGSGFEGREQGYADALRSIKCPLLYVKASSPADLRKLTGLKPDAMVGQVVASGHYMMLSAPDQLNAMLDQFLEVVAQTGSPRNR